MGGGGALDCGASAGGRGGEESIGGKISSQDSVELSGGDGDDVPDCAGAAAAATEATGTVIPDPGTVGFSWSKIKLGCPSC